MRDFDSVVSFAEKCGTKVPASLHDMFANVSQDPDAMAKASQLQLDTFIDQLIERECRHFHIYTLNQSVNIKRCNLRQEVKSLMPLSA